MVALDWRVRRFAQAVFTVWAVLTLSFALIRLMPGNAADFLLQQMQNRGMSPAQAYQMVEYQLNINPQDPLLVAYVKYIADILAGDLGMSTWFDAPVADILANAVPWTIFVLSWAIFISFTLGIMIGALMAYWEGGKFDMAFTTYAMTMTSIPFYVLAILLLIAFGFRTGWFPTNGRAPEEVAAGFNWPYISGVINHAVLPVFSLLVASGAASLSMRGNSIRVLGEDYLRVARLRGLSDSRIALQYVARNAILPLYTSLMISIGSMFGGAVILETVFVYKGMGWYLLQAVNSRDFPLMMGAFMVITVAVVISLLVADLTYGKLDPRAGSEGREGF